MSYIVTIKNGNQETTIHSPVIERFIEGEISDEINCFSTFTFTIYPDNPGYDLIEPMKTLVEVYNENKNRYDFKGRVRYRDPEMGTDGIVKKTVTCQDRMSYLDDSIQPYQAEKQWSGTDSKSGLQEYIEFLLGNHNAQVEDSKKIQCGDISLQTYLTSSGVYKGTNYQSTWSVLKEKLLNVFGGEMRVRESSGVLYLDYAEQLGETRSTTISLGKNMLSLGREDDPSGIISRLIPLGAKVKVETTTTDEYGNTTTREDETEQRLTIGSVNDGVDYIVDETAEALYGRIYGTVEFDDVHTAAALKEKGEAFLAVNNTLKSSHTLTAADLSYIGQDIDDFQIFDKYLVSNPLIGVNETLRIVKKTTSIDEPYLSSIEMGSLTTYLSDITNSARTELKNAYNELEKVKSEVKNVDSGVRSVVESSITTVQQTIASISSIIENQTTFIDESTTFQNTIRNILQMNADGTTMLFQNITEEINRVENSTSTKYSEIVKYIRFIDGKIVIGIQGDPFSVEIDNSKISFKQNGVQVAYMSNNNLYVGNAVIKAGGKLQLGNFAFVPRSNGNLSLLKVGDVV